MKSGLRRSANVLIALSFIVGSLPLLECNRSFADSKRPAEGSVEFGSKKNPASGVAEKMGAFRSVFADVAEKVTPTVVSVIPTKIDTIVYEQNPFYNFFGEGGDPFQFFFGQPPQQQRRQAPPRQPDVQRQERRQQGLGSGVIVSAEGYVLTNFHVVSGANEIAVKLHDGRELEAKLIGSDSLSDVAVLKIKDNVKDLPVAYLGDSDKLRAGDWAVAIGNPFSFTSSVTTGIVSALGRNVSNDNSYQSFIQTDAAINPGNSGGALVNIDGELIGINTMIYTRSGGFMGIGFAIPINMAKRIMTDLIYRGEVVRGWIGVSIQNIDPATRDALDLGTAKGVLISDVYKGQPADKAGIKRGDIVLSIDGRIVSTNNELRNVVATIPPGKKVPVEVLRGGKNMKLSLAVARRDEKQIENLASGKGSEGGSEDTKDAENADKKLGIKVANITGEYRQKYSLPSDAKGVVVLEIASGHEASGSIREGDVVRQVKASGKDFVLVANVDQFTKATKGLKAGDAVMLLLDREGSSFFTAFKIRK